MLVAEKKAEAHLKLELVHLSEGNPLSNLGPEFGGLYRFMMNWSWKLTVANADAAKRVLYTHAMIYLCYILLLQPVSLWQNSEPDEILRLSSKAVPLKAHCSNPVWI